jgi:hypothetical protein
LERVALTAPITKRKISRLLSIHLFKKGPTSTTEKIIVSPNVNVSIGVVSMTSAVLEAILMPSFSALGRQQQRQPTSQLCGNISAPLIR